MNDSIRIFPVVYCIIIYNDLPILGLNYIFIAIL